MINEDCIDLATFDNDLVYEDLWERFAIDLATFDNDLVYEDDLREQFADDEQNNKKFCEAMKELKSNNIDSSAFEKYY